MLVFCLLIFTQTTSYALRACRLYQAIPNLPRGRYLDCLKIILINNALNLLLPFRSGEVSFPLLMQRFFAIPLLEGTSTLLWLRVLDAQALALVALLFVPMPAAWKYGLCLPLLALPLLLWAGKAAFQVEKPFKTWRQLCLDQALTWLAWGVKTLGLTLALALLSGLPWQTAGLGVLGAEVSSLLPFNLPAGVGTFEAGAMALLALHVPPTTALIKAVVLLHALHLGVAVALGALAGGSGLLGYVRGDLARNRR